MEALARQFPGEVILGVERGFPIERRDQGWREPRHTRVRVVDLSVPANHAGLTAHATADSLHVFSGFFSHPRVWAGFSRLASSQARLAIMSEAPEQTLWTGWLKRLRGRMLAAQWSRRFACVLAIGGVGCEFFERIGFPREKIVPFGYFLDVPPLAHVPAAEPSDPTVRFVSAGQLIRRKGIDLLIRACGSLPKTGWRLDICGDGPQRRALEQLARHLRLSERIEFHGVISNENVRRVLAEADCAVLPSRFDGWGMLVNEALAVGTPVLCSDACGAAVLVKTTRAGQVVPSGRPDALAGSLAAALTRGRVRHHDRATNNAATAAVASADQAAKQFLQTTVIRHRTGG